MSPGSVVRAAGLPLPPARSARVWPGGMRQASKRISSGSSAPSPSPQTEASSWPSSTEMATWGGRATPRTKEAGCCSIRMSPLANAKEPASAAMDPTPQRWCLLCDTILSTLSSHPECAIHDPPPRTIATERKEPCCCAPLLVPQVPMRSSAGSVASGLISRARREEDEHRGSRAGGSTSDGGPATLAAISARLLRCRFAAG
mmetsp:Transcript_26966/g.89756  ORF Transcript_26966/g.89756 Transcript_26966/m.89756 type:complete len:202 (+) Transcript_26966:98-703(+)